MLRRNKSVIGLDLGTQAFKAIELTLDGSEPTVTGFARVEIGPETDRSEALSELMARGKFHTKQVVTSMAGNSVVVRYIPMVEMNDSELKQAIAFESDKYIPFDPEDVILDCQRLKSHSAGEAEGPADGQMSVVLVACQKQVLRNRLDDIVAHGLTPIAVDVDGFALAESYDLCNAPEEGADDVAIALVDVGASRTQINVMRAGETCFSREIGMGGGDMTKATARRLGIETFEAEAIKRESGDREIEVGRAIAPVIEDLISELGLSLDFVENREGVRVDEVLLSGGAIMAPGLVGALEQGTGRPARLWNPLDGLRISESGIDLEELEAHASTLAVAVGLASRAKKR